MLRAASTARHVVALNVARAVAKSDAAAAVNTADVAPCYPDHGGLNGNVCYAFSFFHGATNGTNCGIEIDDETFAQAFGFRCA